jgi:hydroxymethylglutaryl-CoA lyase
MNSLPSSVRIREVGPRDGFQNEPETIPSAEKVRLIDMLSASGLRRMEVTSFVRPDVIPQLADATEVLAGVQRREGVAFSVLIPNEKGLERALEMRDRFDEISVFLSASETHNRRNVNRSIEESLDGLERTLAAAGEAGLRCEGVIATSFGCPYEGEVAPERVFEIAERLAGAGCAEVGFGDTTGMANPRQVHEFFATARERLPGAGDGEEGAGVELTAHFHNTRGQGLANVLAALEEGVDSFEASFGELGGCPVPPGSTGNVSTEDVVSMLHEMGIETGIDLSALVEASRAAQDVLGRPLGSHVLRAGPVDWHRDAPGGGGHGVMLRPREPK